MIYYSIIAHDTCGLALCTMHLTLASRKVLQDHSLRASVPIYYLANKLVSNKLIELNQVRKFYKVLIFQVRTSKNSQVLNGAQSTSDPMSGRWHAMFQPLTVAPINNAVSGSNQFLSQRTSFRKEKRAPSSFLIPVLSMLWLFTKEWCKAYIYNYPTSTETIPKVFHSHVRQRTRISKLVGREG